MAPPYDLYGFWASSCSWRVRAALEWKRVPYEYHAVDVRKPGGGEQFDESFTALNPNQRVPVLVADSHALAQSSAILEFLEEAHPERPLLPADVFQRARVRNLCALVACDTQPLQNNAVVKKVAELQTPGSEQERQAAATAWSRAWITRGFAALETELAQGAGVYCVGDELTLADLYLLPQVFNARAVEVEMQAFPVISRVVAALEKLPELANTWPERQPDAP